MILIACSILLCINSAITWENTNELQNALYVYDITVGLNGYIYAGTKIDSTSLDCGRVFVSQDMWNWQRCSGVPWVVGDPIEGVYALINGAGDTLFAGTGVYHSGDVPRIHKSSDGGATWTPLNPYGSFKTGSRVYALLEDNLGILHLGNNYWGMSAAYPRYSTDRGVTWDTGTGFAYHADEWCFCQASDNAIYLGAWSDYIHRSTDNGVTWAATTPPVNISDTYSIIEVSNDTIFAGTNADIGRLFMTTDQGDTWTEKGDGYFNSTTAIRSLLYASDGAIYAGTSPNAEVFVSVDKGDTWISTGVLSGANTVYKIIEATKFGTRQDSTFLFAATGPNGDVFRGLLYIVGIDERNLGNVPEANPFVFCKTPVRGNEVMLNVRVNSREAAKLTIVDASGAVAGQGDYVLHQGNNSMKIEMENMGQGVYFFYLDVADQTFVRKLILLK
ncbi:MAG: hypothetical protein WBB67_09780 [bacterium]